MGARCRVHSHAVIGDLPQDKRGGDKPTRVEIGDDNVFREHVTVHRGTRDSITKIGSNNLFMVGCHVAHDVTIGTRCVIANAVQLAGHSVVEDHATFGGLAGIAQFVRVGESAFVAAGAMVERDVPPFCIVQGDRARVRAVNRVGLERRGVPAASIAEIERVFRAVFSRKTTRADALASLSSDDELAKRLIASLK
jgi:UDP-N-acetylglucosamine acyltransferase